MRHLDKTAGTQRVLENGIQADTGKGMQANTQIERETSRQAGRGGLGSRPGCGEVAGERVVWSGALDIGEWVIGGRIFCGVGTATAEGRILFTSREREGETDREWGKVRTMTQGHEPHGDGGGREELLIRACGISYGYHRTDGVLPSWRLLSRHPVAITPWGTSSTPAWLFEQGELGVKFTREAVYPQGVMKHKLTVNDFLAFYLSWIHSSRAESHDFPPPNAFFAVSVWLASACWKYCIIIWNVIWISSEAITAVLISNSWCKRIFKMIGQVE